MIVRRARPTDASALLEISRSIADGMTTMPKDLAAWQSKLQQVEDTMVGGRSPDQGLYFLVLENQESGELIGTASIHAGVGKDRPFYTYRLTKHVRASAELGIQITGDMLNLVNDFTGDTELGSLYLKPEYRGSGAGRVMAASRFLLMAEFPERFGDRVFAEIRGWLDERGESPFWENLGRKFFNLSYEEADNTSASRGVQFISDLMPRTPIYLELLADEAVRVIGVPHKDSVAAMKFMEEEGFQYRGSIDIFDAGPVMESERDRISSLQKVQSFRFSETLPNEGLDQSGSGCLGSCLVSNGDIENYRMLTARPQIMADGGLGLSVKIADELRLKPGQQVNMMKLR